MQDVQDQLETALSKIDDLENRSRRYNFRLLGLPEKVKEVQPAIWALIKALIPDIPDHRLELYRTHRALKLLCSGDLPRDIIVKPHFYTVKEEVIKRLYAAENLTFQGQPIQIFADLSPYTLQKWRTLKPLLQVLTQNEITYRHRHNLHTSLPMGWGLPAKRDSCSL